MIYIVQLLPHCASFLLLTYGSQLHTAYFLSLILPLFTRIYNFCRKEKFRNYWLLFVSYSNSLSTANRFTNSAIQLGPKKICWRDNFYTGYRQKKCCYKFLKLKYDDLTQLILIQKWMFSFNFCYYFFMLPQNSVRGKIIWSGELKSHLIFIVRFVTRV